MKNENGITLVSLVVTIVIMLILASVSIGSIKTGLIDKTKLAKSQAEQTLVKEKVDMAVSECEMEFFESGEQEILQYYYENLSKHLIEFSNINISINSENILLTFEYNNKSYSFIVTPHGASSVGKLLFGNVNIGEFISYPKTYTDAISGIEFGSNNGWVVIDDGIMTGTSGKIKIMSYGIPGKWLCKSTDADTISNFYNNFGNEKIFSYEGTKISASEMLVENISTDITPLSLKEMNNAYNKLYNSNRDENSRTGEITNGNDMFCNQTSNMYWLVDNSQLLIFANKSILSSDYMLNIRNGVKIVITLNSNLTGNYENGVWKIN